MDDFPSNRQLPQARPVREEGPGKQEEVKQVRRVIEGEVIRRKKPMLRRFRDLFVGDGRSVKDMVLEDILVPGLRDMFYDAFTSGVEGMLYRGDHRPRGRRPSQRGGGGGWHNGGTRYDRMGSGSRERREDPRDRDRREMSDRGRARHDFDEVILSTRAEADEVLGQLYDLLEKYDAVSVHDLYHLVGISSTPMDHKWGWTELFNSGITRTRGGGYLLDLPSPEYLKD
jgi:hypothetical protein